MIFWQIFFILKSGDSKNKQKIESKSKYNFLNHHCFYIFTFLNKKISKYFQKLNPILIILDKNTRKLEH